MLQEPFTLPSSGLVTFESMQDMRLYIRQLLSYYEKQFDFYSQKVGSLMRLHDKQQRGKGVTKFKTDDWQKAGMLMINTRETLLGTLEIMLESMEEYKAKLSRTKEVLVGFDEIEDLSIPDGAPLTLYLRNGVPMRVIVDTKSAPQTVTIQSTSA